jgi:hypothetical protein
MLWLLITSARWCAENPDVSYSIKVCDDGDPVSVELIMRFFEENAGLQICRSFRSADEAREFVLEHGLRLLNPIPSH